MNKEKIKDIIIGVLLAIIIILIITTGIVERKKNNQNKIEESTNTQVDNQEETKDVKTLNYLAIGTNLYDKLNEMYEVNAILPYCGFSADEMHALPVEKFNTNVSYYKTPFKSIEELKSYLSKFAKEDIANHLIYNTEVITDTNSLDQNTLHDYIISDNSLYCRSDARKGYLSKYIGYEITITKIEENTIEYNIKSSFEGDNSEIIYKDKPFTITRDSNTNNWSVSEFNFHGSVYDEN